MKRLRKWFLGLAALVMLSLAPLDAQYIACEQAGWPTCYFFPDPSGCAYEICLYQYYCLGPSDTSQVTSVIFEQDFFVCYPTRA